MPLHTFGSRSTALETLAGLVYPSETNRGAQARMPPALSEDGLAEILQK